MTREDIIELVDDEAIIYDNLDSAIIGVANRCGMPSVVCYDYDKVIEALKDSFEVTEQDLDEFDISNGVSIDDKKYEMAVEWYDYNIIGGYLGEYTPIVVTTKID